MRHPHRGHTTTRPRMHAPAVSQVRQQGQVVVRERRTSSHGSHILAIRGNGGPGGWQTGDGAEAWTSNVRRRQLRTQLAEEVLQHRVVSAWAHAHITKQVSPDTKDTHHARSKLRHVRRDARV